MFCHSNFFILKDIGPSFLRKNKKTKIRIKSDADSMLPTYRRLIADLPRFRGNYYHAMRITGMNFRIGLSASGAVPERLREAWRNDTKWHEWHNDARAVYSASSAGGNRADCVRERRIGSLRSASRYADTATSINSTAMPASKCRFIEISSDHRRSPSR